MKGQKQLVQVLIFVSVFLLTFVNWAISNEIQALKPGMSEIRDRAQAAPVKSQTFRDTDFPVSGKKFRLVLFKPPVSSDQERS
jgi:hypothetical protein